MRWFRFDRCINELLQGYVLYFLFRDVRKSFHGLRTSKGVKMEKRIETGDELKMLVCRNLRKHRLKCGLSAEQVAMQFLVEPQNIFNTEAGQHMPKPQTLVNYATVYDCDVLDFFKRGE